ncbi:multicopper oxidase family protein [Streptomyces sp. NPDC002896]|uniref:multicopper oxidase family protein n=1 Tax=Streptomyces sp. NPDC002896 TaxID=3154438 RepID=UPI003326F924
MRTHTRRTVLGASIAVAGSVILGACSGSDSHTGSHSRSGSSGLGPGGQAKEPFVPKGPKGFVDPSGPQVLAVEKKRGSGPVRKYDLTATPTPIDLGGRTVRSWAYGDALPGKEVRVTAGDILQISLANHLPVSTTLHSHGIRLRCDMDGVPDLTQRPIKPGEDFTYHFAVEHPGTYWLHSHSGMQLDRGLYAPLIVEDPKEPLSYDKEWVVVLDDWLDGVDGSTPDAVLAELGGGMGGMDMGEEDGDDHSGHGAADGKKSTGPSRILKGSHSRLLKGMGGAVKYPYYLINGRLPTAPSEFRARPGDRIRLRIINAGGETAFRVSLGGHEMTVTHTDGYPVRHTRTDALLIGMAERYDVCITAKDGVFPLVALAEGKKDAALAILRTGGGTAPKYGVYPSELDGKLVPARRLVPDESVALSRREPDRELRLRLTGNMRDFNWAFDHTTYRTTERRPIRFGERVRLTVINATDMWHPIHLHGHTFAVTGLDSVGPRKDTAPVLPHRKLVLDFDADNPGLWMLHCHNQYHSESGMMTNLAYLK